VRLPSIIGMDGDALDAHCALPVWQRHLLKS